MRNLISKILKEVNYFEPKDVNNRVGLRNKELKKSINGILNKIHTRLEAYKHIDNIFEKILQDANEKNLVLEKVETYNSNHSLAVYILFEDYYGDTFWEKMNSYTSDIISVEADGRGISIILKGLMIPG